MAALRAIPDGARGWQAKKTSVRCQSCQAISVFDPERVGQRCDFCGSSSLVPYEEIKEAFSPESLLPMKVSENQVRDSIRKWYRTRWFAPNKLKSAALTDTVRSIPVLIVVVCEAVLFVSSASKMALLGSTVAVLTMAVPLISGRETVTS